MRESNQTESTKPEPESQPTAESSSGTLSLLTVVVLAAIIILGSIYWFLIVPGQSVSDTDTGSTAGELAGLEINNAISEADLPEVVATVNGVDVTKDQLLSDMEQTRLAYTEQGVDISDPNIQAEMQQQALNRIVNNELLSQAAVSAGVTITESEIDAGIVQIKGQFPDEETFSAEIASAGLTIEELRQNIHDQLEIDTYLTTEALPDVPAVTDADMRAAYEQLAANGGEGQLPPYEDVSQQIGAQLTQQNQQVVIGELIAELRDAAEIEVML